jgi:hypothetical protein
MTGIPLTHAEHFRWMQAVLAVPNSTFTHAQKTVLVRLALHLNLKTGRCDPSIETIAAGAAVSPRAAQATLATAQQLGWLTRLCGGGRGNTNSYSLHQGKTVATEETLHSSAPFAKTLYGETVNGGAQKGAPPRRKPRTAVHPNTENKKNTNSDEDFARWYAVYPKHRSRATARKAFERAVKVGKATVDELIAGATRYAAERQGQDGQYTKNPATWLNGECWADEPLPLVERAQDAIAAAGARRAVPRL